MHGQQHKPQRQQQQQQQQHAFSSSSSSAAWQAAPPGRPKVIIITGPTAVGKTKLGLELAKQLDGEIISADSVQVYKGLDIGSDKLPLAQREDIPHHLIDILQPDAEFSAGDFHHLGRKAAADIIQRGKTPIVVGGTGFYLRWFIYGKAATPPSNPTAAAKARALIQQAWDTAAAATAAERQATVTAAAVDLQAGQQKQQQKPDQRDSAQQHSSVQQQQHHGSQQQQQQQQQQQEGSQLSGAQSPVELQQQALQGEAAAAAASALQDGSSPASTAAAAAAAATATAAAAAAGVTGLGRVQPKPSAAAAAAGGGTLDSTANTAAAAAAAAAVGGSGLGPAQPTPSAAAAAALSDDQRWDLAVDVVQQLGDAATAGRIRVERNNWYRLQRVLQILIQNGGKPLSAMDVDTTKPLDYDFRCFFLTQPRVELYDRIAYRVEEMVAGGLLAEALLLLQLGLSPNSHVATKAIGYRQACEFMQAALAAGSASTQQLRQLILDIATASRNLVKNQTTWFRDDDLFRWLEVGRRSTEDVLSELLAELDKPQHEGGCGDSGRLDKATQKALKQYVPSLKLYSDEGRCEEALAWVRRAAQQQQQQQQQGLAGAAGAEPPTQ